ncbi:type I secretion system permease/ATPase [Acetobacter sicerae]|uniref:Type I secretion system permease/ATPase n=1 Tax=Acetobacter sicerae TaxID=85325 RepID=A0ABS8VZ25_9PROT|nr:type I secretion system permease/ATPase [Acetobacter sicerae]MCE0745436.1 type I secretion system permease/ATPase [Acetobacter sicerae]
MTGASNTTRSQPLSSEIQVSLVRTLVEFLRFYGFPAESTQLQDALPSEPSIPEIIRQLQSYGLKVGAQRIKQQRLPTTPLPALALMNNRSLRMLVRIGGSNILYFDAINFRPAVMKLEDFLGEWSGILLLGRRKATVGMGEGYFSISWFFSVMMKYRAILSEVLIASFFLQIFALATPFVFQVLVDKVLVNRGISTLDVVVGGLISIAVFEAVLGGLRTFLFSHTTNRVDVELATRLFRHLLGLPFSYFQARRVGDSVARVRELETIRQFLTSSALTLVMDLLFTGVFLAVMLTYSLTLSLIVVISIPIYILVSCIATPLFRHRLEEKFRRGAENQAFLVETVSGIETVKAMAVAPQMQRKWEEQIAGYVTASQSVSNVGNAATQMIQVTGKLVTASTLWLGAHEVMAGEMTVGGLVAFNMLASRVSQPVLRVAQMYQDFHQTRISAERLGDILNTPTEDTDNGNSTAVNLAGGITFDHVSFRHRLDGPLILDDISLHVRPGEIIGLVGSSGSGKSTLTKLLQRLYVPEHGRILVDDVDISTIDTGALRRQIGVVLQDSVLFNMTIRENIALARPALPMEQIIHVARLAGAHDFISTLPEGYNTYVGERGASLSGGQRQRIAIARALACDPRILILDEATSALDYESERIVQNNLRQICRGRTVLIVAHRLSAVRHANRIFALEGGQLMEEGTHEELLKLGGRYATLFALQGGLDAVG